MQYTKIGFRKKEIDISDETNMLIGAIVSTSFLSRLAPMYDKRIIDTGIVVEVMDWVLDYYAAYGESPKDNIYSIYEENAAYLDEATAKRIRGFLKGLSNESKNLKSMNEEYLFDRTKEYFERQFLYTAGKRIVELIDNGDVGGARDIWLEQMKSGNFDNSSGSIFDKETRDLVYDNPIPRVKLVLDDMPALYKLTGDILSDWLVLFMGPMARGKTSMLTELATSAMRSGLSVLFYTLESNMEDVVKRVYRNMFALTRSKEMGVEYPSFVDGEDDSDDIDIETITRPPVERRVVVERAMKQWLKSRTIRGKRILPYGDIRVKAFPSFSAGYEDIVRDLDMRRIQHGFIPQIIVIDYVGIMAAAKGYVGRDAYDYNTKMLKRLAEERRCVVVSAIQGSRKSLESRNIKQVDVPEDIRQLAHVDVMIGLNQGFEEKERFQMRLSILKHRWREFNPLRQALILQQLDVGQFYLDGKIIYSKNTKDDKKRLLQQGDNDE